jgi:hypothetical protein
MSFVVLKKKITLNRAIKHGKLPIKAVRESSELRQRAPQ